MNVVFTQLPPHSTQIMINEHGNCVFKFAWELLSPHPIPTHNQCAVQLCVPVNMNVVVTPPCPTHPSPSQVRGATLSASEHECYHRDSSPHPTPPPSMISACKWFCLASSLNLSGDVSEARWIRKWCEIRWVVPPETTCNSVLTNSTRVLICFILVLHGHLPDAKWDGGVWSHVGTGFAHVLVAYVALFSYSASNLMGHQTSLFDPGARGGAPNVEEHYRTTHMQRTCEQRCVRACRM